MKPALIILVAWLLFGGTHPLLSASKLRERWLPRLSLMGFSLLFTGVTGVTMSGLIAAVAIYGNQGIVGPDLSRFELVRWGLIGLGSLGAILAVAGLINYPNSPMAVLATRQRTSYLKQKPLQPPTSVERVSRHPFFTGLAMLMLAHTLLATTLAEAVYFGGFVFLAAIGIPLQDRKLRKRWRETYSEFEDQTSILPFGSTEPNAGKKTPLIQWGIWISSVALTVLLFGIFHPIWAFANGAPFAAFILLFGMLGVLSSLLLRRSNQ